MDDGEAKEGNDTEAGKTRQLFPTQRGVRLYEGLLVRLPSPENNSRCGAVEGWLGQRWEYGGVVRPARQHSRPREERAGSPAGACLSDWSMKSRD